MQNRTRGTKNTLLRIVACMLTAVLLLGALPATAEANVRRQVNDFIIAVDQNVALNQLGGLLNELADVYHNAIRADIAALVAGMNMASVEIFVDLWNGYFGSVAALPSPVGTRAQAIAFIESVPAERVVRMATDLFGYIATIDHNIIRAELLTLVTVLPEAYLQDIVLIFNRLF